MICFVRHASLGGSGTRGRATDAIYINVVHVKLGAVQVRPVR